ncbi:hypothetical protein BC831DRAFT_442649, partial [Entophlyctis helioformis]
MRAVLAVKSSTLGHIEAQPVFSRARKPLCRVCHLPAADTQMRRHEPIIRRERVCNVVPRVRVACVEPDLWAIQVDVVGGGVLVAMRSRVAETDVSVRSAVGQDKRNALRGWCLVAGRLLPRRSWPRVGKKVLERDDVHVAQRHGSRGVAATRLLVLCVVEKRMDAVAAVGVEVVGAACVLAVVVVLVAVVIGACDCPGERDAVRHEQKRDEVVWKRHAVVSLPDGDKHGVDGGRAC